MVEKKKKVAITREIPVRIVIIFTREIPVRIVIIFTSGLHKHLVHFCYVRVHKNLVSNCELKVIFFFYLPLSTENWTYSKLTFIQNRFR